MPILLFLPFHREVSQFVYRPTGQHIADWDKCPAPPIGYDALLLAPQGSQTSSCAVRWGREGVQFQTDALPLFRESVEVGGDTRRAYSRDCHTRLVKLLGKGLGEALYIGLRGAI